MMIGKGAIFRALDRAFIQKLFVKKKMLFFPSVRGEISDIKIERISPNWAKESCLVRYEILFDDNTKKIVRGTAKAKKSKKSIWQIMKYLYSRDFSTGKLQIAKPLGYIADINLLLYEEAPGSTLTEIIEKENETIAKRILKNTARWLVKLHSLGFKQKQFPKAVFIGFTGYKNIFQKIGKYMSELKNDLIPINKLNFVNKLWQYERALIHNDFYPGNFVSNKEIVFGLDFDRAGLGPFLMDVATFYGALEFPKEIWDLKLPKKQIRHFQDVFLQEYCKLRKLSYFQIKKDLKKFLVKILLDQIHYYVAFTIRGWDFMDQKTREIFIFKIKSLLLKTKQCFRDL